MAAGFPALSTTNAAKIVAARVGMRMRNLWFLDDFDGFGFSMARTEELLGCNYRSQDEGDFADEQSLSCENGDSFGCIGEETAFKQGGHDERPHVFVLTTT